MKTYTHNELRLKALKISICWEKNKLIKFFKRVHYVFLFLKNLIIKNKATVLKSLLIIIVLATLAIGTYFILRACGFTTVEDFTRLRDNLGDTLVFWLVIGLLQIVQVIFIPISNQLITGSCAILFNNELWKVFLVSWISIWIATLILYVIGRYGGQKILNWLLKDKEQVNKCINFLNKGWIFYPIGCLAPIIPDDIITVLAGTAKMKFWLIVVSSLITRAIDIACSVWGFGLALRYWWILIIMVIAYIALIVFSIIYFKKISKKVDKTTE